MCVNILVRVHGIHTVVGSEENKYKEIGGGPGGKKGGNRHFFTIFSYFLKKING